MENSESIGFTLTPTMPPTAPTIRILDTTLRDGEQTQGVSYTSSEKATIAQALLSQLGVHRIEIASAGTSLGELETVERITQWAKDEGYLHQIEILGFIGTKSVDWIKQSGAKVINLLTKGSEHHCITQLKQSPSEHIQCVQKTINYAKQHGLNVNVYLEDWSNGYMHNRQYVFNLLAALKDYPIEHFMLPDTLGVMSPDEVFDSMKIMCKQFPQLQFDFHPHNDYGLGLANVMSAVKAGIKNIHCTVNCLGERAGNVSLAEVVVTLKDKMGIEMGIDESKIMHISKMVETFSGKSIAANSPIIGADVFTQTAGIHADGDLKGNLYETELSPKRFSRSRQYALGKLSGKASLIKNLNFLGITLNEEERDKILKRIIKMGDLKQSITIDDLPFIIADVQESKAYNHIKLIDCNITSSMSGHSIAVIEVDILDGRYHERGEGNGGLEAFINAISKPLQNFSFIFPNLIDYQVRIPMGGHSDALTECIISWEIPDQKIYRSRGLHSNQVLSSVLATLRMINYLLQEQRFRSTDL